MTLILSNDDVEKLLTMRECIEVLEDAYVELAEGRGVSRTRSDCFTPTARADALYSLKSMDGVVPKLGVGAVRINSDIITWPKRGNNMRREKVPAAPNNRYVGLVLLFSIENGEPLAILPDGVMQRMRVGAANGLGVKYLAREDATTVGILGSGWQAGAQLMAACAVRDIEIDPLLQPQCGEPRGLRRGDERRCSASRSCPVAQPEEAIAGADIVMCATNSIDHIFFERWIEPGMHVSSIKRPEIEVEAIKRADRVVIHWNEPSPIHVAAKGVVIEEKAEGRGWQLAERDRLRDAADPARAHRRPGRRAASPTTTSPASSTISGSATSSPPPARVRLPQGEGERPRPRSADRLVHRGRASLAHDAAKACPDLIRAVNLRLLELRPAPFEVIERLARPAADNLRAALRVPSPTDPPRSPAGSRRPSPQ